MERPDLSHVSPEVLAYIEYLEAQFQRQPSRAARPEPVEEILPPLEPDEPPTTVNVVTLTQQGWIKRTPRHLYSRQRRGGMGVFDIETHGEDAPIALTLADESQSLLLFTDHARAFRLPLNKLPESPVRARGESILGQFPLEPDEHFVVALPSQASGYVCLVSQRGMVRSLRHHLFGDYLKPGTAFYNYREFGPLAAACWSSGNGDLLLATRSGAAIRFSEKLVPPQGILGMKVDPQDRVTGVTPVRQEGGVFFLGDNGKGTVRLMSGFNPNKSPGGSGKNAMKTDNLVAAIAVDASDDLFIFTTLSKIIRFKAGEVPASDSVVQGVVCMGLRGDECVSAAKASI